MVLWAAKIYPEPGQLSCIFLIEINQVIYEAPLPQLSSAPLTPAREDALLTAVDCGHSSGYKDNISYGTWSIWKGNLLVVVKPWTLDIMSFKLRTEPFIF